VDGVHDSETGRIDATRVAAALGISLRQLSEALGQKYGTVHKTPASSGLQEALGPYARTLELLRKVHGTRDQVLRWLNTPHRELDERPPLSVMLEGRADVVRDMVEAAYLGIPT
jgi:uncharacterized protein (DUF2384 family)